MILDNSFLPFNLSFYFKGWHCVNGTVGNHDSRIIHEKHACQRVIVRLVVIYQLATINVGPISVFLAIKYASAAMKETNISVGKSMSGGSIIVTASGWLLYSYNDDFT